MVGYPAVKHPGTLSTCPGPANRGEISHENMAARGEFFRSSLLPVLSAEPRDHDQSEEINVIDESQAENRPVPNMAFPH